MTMRLSTKHEALHFVVVPGFDNPSEDLFLRTNTFNEHATMGGVRSEDAHRRLGKIVGQDAFNWEMTKGHSPESAGQLALNVVASLGNEHPPLTLPNSAHYFQGAREHIQSEIERILG